MTEQASDWLLWRSEPRCRGCRKEVLSRVHCLDCDADLCAQCADGDAPADHEPGHATVVYREPPELSEADFLEECGRMLERAAQDRPAPAAARPSVGRPVLRAAMRRRREERFADYFTRRACASTELGPQARVMSLGIDRAMDWRGVPLYKNAFDFALYSMLLYELKPATILELGSGRGGSALWFSDVTAAFGVPARVLSVDLSAPDVEARGVSFVRGDAAAIGVELADELARAPHPWLVSEDMHNRVCQALSALDPYLREGDYVFVEDSYEKENELGRWLSGREGLFQVDTLYTDFFGRNATSALDSIFRRTAGP